MKTLHIYILRSARSPRQSLIPKYLKTLPQGRATFSSSQKLARTVKGYIQIAEDPNDNMVTKAEKKKAQKFELKTPKGTKDCMIMLILSGINS
jgi:hypothetical protein